MTSKEKAADEKFCTSCGEAIKKKAEICPNCGVANNKKSSSSVTKSTNQSATSTSNSNDSSPHDPSNYETNVSDSWWYGVAASVVLWITGYTIMFIQPSALSGFFFLIAWVLMPLSIYYDRQWVQATTNWNPKESLWIILSIIPPVCIVSGIVYTFKRYTTEQVSAPTTNSRNNNNQSAEDAAIQQLRERYADGELTDVEFEQKVEKVIETEQADSAEEYINSEK